MSISFNFIFDSEAILFESFFLVSLIVFSFIPARFNKEKTELMSQGLGVDYFYYEQDVS